MPSIVTTLSYTHFNTGLTASVADSTTGMTANAITSAFAYDAMGRRTRETYSGTVYRSYSDSSYASLTASSLTLQDATIAYDSLGRLATFSNASSSGSTTVTQSYDAAGNIRRTQTIYPNLVTGGTASSDKWFTYDAMNRMVVADGTFNGSSVVAGTNGSALAYDVAGNRKFATKAGVTETYNYDADNQLTTVVRGGLTTASTTRDIRGRVTQYIEYDRSSDNPNNGIANHRYNIVYNARGQVSSENTFQWIDNGKDVPSAITNTYDNYGNLTYQRSINTNGLKDTWQSWTHGWTDGAVVASSQFDRDYYNSNSIFNSAQTYDGLGRLQRATIADGKPRGVHFALSSDGQILSRVQNDGSSDDPRDYHLFVSGKQIAEYTNNAKEDVRNFDYQQLIANKISNASGSGDFFQGATSGTQGGEFGTSGYDPMNPITSGSGQSSRSRSTVRSGDTLHGIAQQCGATRPCGTSWPKPMGWAPTLISPPNYGGITVTVATKHGYQCGSMILARLAARFSADRRSTGVLDVDRLNWLRMRPTRWTLRCLAERQHSSLVLVP